MNKQFNSNQEINKFVCDYIRNHYDLSKSYFASQFGIINDPLDWLGSWEEYARIIFNAGYNIDNLRSGLCDEFLNAYDNLKEVK